MNDLVREYGAPVTIARPSAGEYVNGHYIAGDSPEEVEIFAYIEPMTSREMRSLPDGQEATAGIVIYSETDLRPADPENGTKGDLVPWDGSTFEVVKVKSLRGIEDVGHCQAFAVEVEE